MSKESGNGTIYTAALGDSSVQSLLEMGKEQYKGPANLQNFDPKTPEGMRRFLSAAGDSKLLASELKGEVFELVYWLAEPASFRNEETGEIVTGVRVTMWDKNERRLTCASWAVARYLDRLIRAMGPGPYDPPVGLSIENDIRRDSKRTYVIEMVDLHASPAKGAK